MKIIYSTLIVSILTLLSACVKEDFFGESNSANIKNIVVSNQSGNAAINTTDNSVTVEIPGGVDLSNITVQTLEISSFSKASISVGDTIDLTNDVEIIITAENGAVSEWTISAFVASATPQLANNNLNFWYKTATDYFEPGESADNTIWGTGNKGTQLLNKLATVPEDLGDGNLAAKMITLSNGVLGATFGTPISAGSIFTGIFDPDKIDPSNPQAAIEFGTPFAGRPSKLKITYSYEPGADNKDVNGDALPYGDACDIYALLEVRLNGTIERLATAWLRNDVNEPNMITVEVPFTYGELDSTFPSYMRPPNNSYVDAQQVDFITPTHITFVASSSYDGANFAGAVGSTLIIDDVEMIYE